MSVVVPQSFDISKLTTSDVKALDNGSKCVYVNYNGGRLRTQTPQMPTPFGAGDYQGNANFKVNLSFRDLTSSDSLSRTRATAFHSMLQAIDNFIIDKATANAGKWLGIAGASRDVVKYAYTPSIRLAKSKDGAIRTDVPATVSIALKQRNGAFDAEIYDKDLKRISVSDEGKASRFATPVETLVRGTEVTCLLDLTSIWIAGGKFGATWKLHSAWVNVPGASASSGPGFVTEDGGSAVPLVVSETHVSASEESSLLAAMLPAAAGAGAEEEEEVEEEEEAEEEEGEAEPEEVIPAPPVPAAKKVAAAPAPAPAPATVVPAPAN